LAYEFTAIPNKQTKQLQVPSEKQIFPISKFSIKHKNTKTPYTPPHSTYLNTLSVCINKQIYLR